MSHSRGVQTAPWNPYGIWGLTHTNPQTGLVKFCWKKNHFTVKVILNHWPKRLRPQRPTAAQKESFLPGIAEAWAGKGACTPEAGMEPPAPAHGRGPLLCVKCLLNSVPHPISASPENSRKPLVILPDTPHAPFSGELPRPRLPPTPASCPPLFLACVLAPHLPA